MVKAHFCHKSKNCIITTHYITISKLRCSSFIMPTIYCLPLNSNYILLFLRSTLLSRFRIQHICQGFGTRYVQDFILLACRKFFWLGAAKAVNKERYKNYFPVVFIMASKTVNKMPPRTEFMTSRDTCLGIVWS